MKAFYDWSANLRRLCQTQTPKYSYWRQNQMNDGCMKFSLSLLRLLAATLAERGASESRFIDNCNIRCQHNTFYTTFLPKYRNFWRINWFDAVRWPKHEHFDHFLWLLWACCTDNSVCRLWILQLALCSRAPVIFYEKFHINLRGRCGNHAWDWCV